MQVISFFNHKGGVGKTTTTMNLAQTLALQGKKVLVVDLDPQANLTQSLGFGEEEKSLKEFFTSKDLNSVPMVEVNQQLHLIPSALELESVSLNGAMNVNWSFRVRDIVKAVRGDYDFTLLDCPPNLGLLSVNALIASNLVVIVQDAEKLSVNNLRNVISTLEDVTSELNPNVDYRILINKMQNLVIKKEINRALRGQYGSRVLETEIHERVAIKEASAMEKDVITYQPDSPTTEEYRQLAEEIDTIL